MNNCKGYCEKYRFRGITADLERYSAGAKYCSVCCIFVDWEDRQCPCCAHILRIKPKYGKYRQRIKVHRY